MAVRRFPKSEPGSTITAPEGYKPVLQITDGAAKIKIVEPQLKQSEAENDQFLAWVLFDEETHPDLAESCVLTNWTLVKQSMWFLKNSLRLCGRIDDKEYGKGFDMEDEVIQERLDGMEGWCLFEGQMYDDKVSSKITDFIEEADVQEKGYPLVKAIIRTEESTTDEF